MVFSPGRPAPRVARVLAALVVACALPFTFAVTASAATPTLGSVLAAAKGAIAKQKGVHLVVASKSSSSSVTERVVADLGAKDGYETVSAATATVTVRVTPAYAYLSGNTKGLEEIIGLSAAQEKKLGGNWMAMKAGTQQYASFANDITAPSVTAVLPKPAGTKLSTEVASGVHLYVLKWSSKATSSSPALSISLTLSARGATLPVEQSTTAANGSKQTAVFSKWGEAVHVQVPPARSTVTYTKVMG
jgi:hypothetical protein